MQFISSALGETGWEMKRGRNVEFIDEKLQEDIRKNLEWSVEWGIGVSVEKK